MLFRSRLESNVVSYSASISASEKGSQWAEALGLLREMFDRRLESDVVSYSASISASGKGSQEDIANFIARKRIRECKHVSQWVMGFALLPELLDRRIQAGMITYSAVLGSCEKSRMWAQALRSL